MYAWTFFFVFFVLFFWMVSTRARIFGIFSTYFRYGFDRYKGKVFEIAREDVHGTLIHKCLSVHI